MASATRARSPPDSEPARRSTESPEKPKRPRCPWIGAAAPVRAQVGDDVVQRAVARHLREILAVVRDPHRVRYPHLAAVQRPLADDGAEQVDFPAPFGPTSPTTSPRRIVALNPPAAVRSPMATAHVRPRPAPGRRRARRPRAGAPWRPPRRAAGSSRLHPLQPPPPALGLGAVLPGDVPADVVLLRRDHPRLLGEGALLREPPLGALAEEGLVVAGVGDGGAGLQVQDVIHHRLEEGPIVADEENGRVDAAR